MGDDNNKHIHQDLPSELEYKDLGRNFGSVRAMVEQQEAEEGGSPPAIVERTDARPNDSSGENLPSTMTYKDQGRDYQDVMVVSPTMETPAPPNATAPSATGKNRSSTNSSPQNDRTPPDLPSNISYKDQGRELHVLIPQQQQQTSASSEQDMIPNAVSNDSTDAPSLKSNHLDPSGDQGIADVYTPQIDSESSTVMIPIDNPEAISDVVTDVPIVKLCLSTPKGTIRSSMVTLTTTTTLTISPCTCEYGTAQWMFVRPLRQNTKP